MISVSPELDPPDATAQQIQERRDRATAMAPELETMSQKVNDYSLRLDMMIRAVVEKEWKQKRERRWSFLQELSMRTEAVGIDIDLATYGLDQSKL